MYNRNMENEYPFLVRVKALPKHGNYGICVMPVNSNDNATGDFTDSLIIADVHDILCVLKQINHTAMYVGIHEHPVYKVIVNNTIGWVYPDLIEKI